MKKRYHTAAAVQRDLFDRFPRLASCQAAIEAAYNALLDCYRSGGKVLTAGNGGRNTASSVQSKRIHTRR